jgi:hypothetical protein
LFGEPVRPVGSPLLFSEPPLLRTPPLLRAADEPDDGLSRVSGILVGEASLGADLVCSSISSVAPLQSWFPIARRELQDLQGSQRANQQRWPTSDVLHVTGHGINTNVWIE